MGKEFNKVCCGQKPEQGAHSGVLAAIKSGERELSLRGSAGLRELSLPEFAGVF